MYLQPNVHQGHGWGEQPQETLVEATLKGAWRRSKHSRPHGVVVMEKRCRRALGASCLTDARLVPTPRPSELGDLAAPVCTGISTHNKDNFCINSYSNVAWEKAAPCPDRSFSQRPAAALSQAEGTVPPERAHRLSSGFAYCIAVKKGFCFPPRLSLRPLEKRSGRNSCSAIAFALLQSPGLPAGLSFGGKRLPDLVQGAHSSCPAHCRGVLPAEPPAQAHGSGDTSMCMEMNLFRDICEPPKGCGSHPGE